MIRTIALLLLSVAALLFLTGCGESIEDVKEEAAFVNTCEDAGGEFSYGPFGRQCNFEGGGR